MSQAIEKTLRDSAAMRWTALLLLALAMFCSYIFMDILSPIKDLMQDTRGWDSTAFGTMQGAEVFLNVFVFFLIFAGIILDKMGVRFTMLLSTAVMVIGATVKWYAVSESFMGSGLEDWFNHHLNYIPVFDELGVSPFYQGMPASAKFAACGFMIFGCGCEMAGITVSRGIVKWFKGREMALAMGSEMALARLGVATCMIFSPFFARLGGQVSVSRSVAFGVVLMCIALIMTIVYFFMDKKLDAQTGEAEEKDDPFKVSDIGRILSDSGFWLVALLCVLYYSAIFPFQKYAVNMLQCNLTLTEPSADLLGKSLCHHRAVCHHAARGCCGFRLQLPEVSKQEIRFPCRQHPCPYHLLLYGLHAPDSREHLCRVPSLGCTHHPHPRQLSRQPWQGSIHADTGFFAAHRLSPDLRVHPATLQGQCRGWSHRCLHHHPRFGSLLLTGTCFLMALRSQTG